MTATQFTDDAYNKEVSGPGLPPGTLVGNWFEERCIRDATGEGRRLPQHHIRRSGLLKDFTRMPSDGPRAQDDTFERMYGHRKYDVWTLSSHEVGKPDGLVHVTEHVYDNVQAAGRIAAPSDRVRAQRDKHAFEAHAREYVAAELAAADEVNERRYFNTSSGDAYQLPERGERAAHATTSARQELMCGPPPSEQAIFARKGCDFESTQYYAQHEAVTCHTEFAANADTRSGMRVTPMQNGFKRDCTMSTPISENLKPGQDGFVALNRAPPASQPAVLSRPPVTALVDVKSAIVEQLTEAHGRRGFVELRKLLEQHAAKDATVLCTVLAQVLYPQGRVHPAACKTYCTQLATMSKDRCLVAKALDSLRPSGAVANARMQQIAACFDALRSAGDHADHVVLSEWAKAVGPEMQAMLCEDFGVPVDVVDRYFVYLNKSSFYEYLVDFSAALDDAAFASFLAELLGQ